MNDLTLREAAEVLNGVYSHEGLKSKIKRGTLKARKDEYGQWRVSRSDILALAGKEESYVDKAKRVLEGYQTPEERLGFEVEQLRAELKKAHKLVAEHETKYNFDNIIKEAILNVVEDNPYVPVIKKPKLTRRGTVHEMLLLVSDAHYGEYVDPEAMFGIKYNPEIALQRLEYMTEETIRHMEMRDFPIQKITIAVLGDMLSGNIHEELERTNVSPISIQWAEMSQALTTMGNTMAQAFPDVEMIVIPGNHPRLRKKPYFKTKWDNFEHMMGIYIQALARDNFKVTVPKDLVYVHDILGNKVGMLHGDGFKSNSFAGIPFYGLAQRRAAFQASRKELGIPMADMMVMGHLHQLMWWPGRGCDMIINGAIKGSDEYAFDNWMNADPPRQALLTLNAEKGITSMEVIDLEHIGKE